MRSLHSATESIPLAATRESPCAATKTQYSKNQWTQSWLPKSPTLLQQRHAPRDGWHVPAPWKISDSVYWEPVASTRDSMATQRGQRNWRRVDLSVTVAAGQLVLSGRGWACHMPHKPGYSPTQEPSCSKMPTAPPWVTLCWRQATGWISASLVNETLKGKWSQHGAWDVMQMPSDSFSLPFPCDVKQNFGLYRHNWCQPSFSFSIIRLRKKLNELCKQRRTGSLTLMYYGYCCPNISQTGRASHQTQEEQVLAIFISDFNEGHIWEDVTKRHQVSKQLTLPCKVPTSSTQERSVAGDGHQP